MSRELSYPSRWDFNVNGFYSYQEYRKAVEFEKLTAFAFDRQTRELVGSNEELAAVGIQVGQAITSQLGAVKDTLSGGFQALAGQLDGIDGTLQDIHATLGMGLSIIGINTGRMADTLDQLLHAVKNPSLTWALEQYEIARDEVRRGLLVEAYETLQKAIKGFGSNPGYKTEFRFHLLLGSLHLSV